MGLKRTFQFRSCLVLHYHELISSITPWSSNLDTFDTTGSCIQNFGLSKSNNFLVTAFMAGLQQFDLNAIASLKDNWLLFSPARIPLPSIREFPGSNYISHQTLLEAVPFHTQWAPRLLPAATFCIPHYLPPHWGTRTLRRSPRPVEHFHLHGSFSGGASPVWEWTVIVTITEPFWSFPLHVLHFPKEVCIQLPIPWSIVLCFIEFCPISAL